MKDNIEVLDFENKNSKFSILETYGENLSKKFYITNPAIGRDKEINETILILLKKKKSALLTGKPGIGKTAIVEGLGYRMQRGEVPDALKNYELIKVNITSLLGNVVSEGRNENKLQLLVEELKEKSNIILFIDEVHLLVSRNTSNLNVDFANMLKPGLDRGTIKMIGATTTEEYEYYILRDRAFLRRFQRVDVAEPTQEETVKILMGTIPKMESQTGVKMKYNSYVTELLIKSVVSATSEFKRVYGIAAMYPDVALSVLSQAFSNALYYNKKEVDVIDFYNAIKSSRKIYPDSIIKELDQFRETFKDLCKEENVILPIVRLADLEKEQTTI